LPWDDLERNARPPDEVLPAVLTRGRQLRRRRRVAVRGVGTMAVAICLIGVAAAAASSNGPSAHRVIRAAGEPSTTTATEEAPLAPSTTTTITGTTAVPTASSTTTPRPGSPTTTLYCHNSTDPRCGPFRWVGDPGPNDPATDVVEWEPKAPRVGDDVTFTVTWDDPDAPILRSSRNVCIGDGSPCVSGTSLITCDRYGPWDLPARQPFHERWTFHHTFTKTGVFQVSNEFRTTSNKCAEERFDPYGSRGAFSGEIAVVEADTTTTTR
jgi:hypothetical protein